MYTYLQVFLGFLRPFPQHHCARSGLIQALVLMCGRMRSSISSIASFSYQYRGLWIDDVRKHFAQVVPCGEEQSGNVLVLLFEILNSDCIDRWSPIPMVNSLKRQGIIRLVEQARVCWSFPTSDVRESHLLRHGLFGRHSLSSLCCNQRRVIKWWEFFLIRWLKRRTVVISDLLDETSEMVDFLGFFCVARLLPSAVSLTGIRGSFHCFFLSRRATDCALLRGTSKYTIPMSMFVRLPTWEMGVYSPENRQLLDDLAAIIVEHSYLIEIHSPAQMATNSEVQLSTE